MTLDASGASPLVIALPLSREQNDQSWIQLTRDQYVILSHCPDRNPIPNMFWPPSSS
jgi:hypothetical protein